MNVSDIYRKRIVDYDDDYSDAVAVDITDVMDESEFNSKMLLRHIVRKIPNSVILLFNTEEDQEKNIIDTLNYYYQLINDICQLEDCKLHPLEYKYNQNTYITIMGEVSRAKILKRNHDNGHIDEPLYKKRRLENEITDITIELNYWNGRLDKFDDD